MDHVVYLDAKAAELENILSGKKTMIVRGAAGRKMPHGRVFAGDTLYFLRNNGEGQVFAQAQVRSVLNSDKLSEEESCRLLAEHQAQLLLTPEQSRRWGGKRYLVLIELEAAVPVEPFYIDRRGYGNMDDWLPVGEIGSVQALVN